MSQPKLKILLVEDDPVLGYVVKDFLQKEALSGLAESTVTHTKNVISGILNIAVDCLLFKEVV